MFEDMVCESLGPFDAGAPPQSFPVALPPTSDTHHSSFSLSTPFSGCAPRTNSGLDEPEHSPQLLPERVRQACLVRDDPPARPGRASAPRTGARGRDGRGRAAAWSTGSREVRGGCARTSFPFWLYRFSSTPLKCTEDNPHPSPFPLCLNYSLTLTMTIMVR